MQQIKILSSITMRTEGLDAYLRQISKIPLLTPQEEVDLADRIAAGDRSAEHRLIEGNLRFVVSVAKQYRNTGAPLLDAIQDGNIGLMRAVHSYDHTMGFKFISYAVWWVRQSIMQGLSESSRLIRLPMNQIGLLGKINRAVSAFEQKHGRYPSDEEIAQMIDFPAGKIRMAQSASVKPVSYDAPFEDDPDSSSLIDVLANRNDVPTDHILDRESMSHDLMTAIQVLSPRDRKIVILTYGLDGKGERTMEDIARGLGLTRERVRQIKERALRILGKSKASRILVQYL